MASEGFLGRWSRLKRDAVAGSEPSGLDAGPLEQGAQPAAPGGPAVMDAARPGDAIPVDAARPGDAIPAPQGTPPIARRAEDGGGHDDRPPGLPAIDSLGFESDYSPFMRPDVDPGMRVSALKKLFTDPHFNRMDGLDIYIDDYTRPDPIPPALLKRLNQSRLLGLFEEDEPAGNAPELRDATAGRSAVDPAAEQPAPDQPAAEQPAAEQPTAGQPTAEQPTAEQSAAGEHGAARVSDAGAKGAGAADTPIVATEDSCPGDPRRTSRAADFPPSSRQPT